MNAPEPMTPLPVQRSVGESWYSLGSVIARLVVEVAWRNEEFGWLSVNRTVSGSTTVAPVSPWT